MDLRFERQEKFDTWYARYIINQINSRAKGFTLKERPEVNSWASLVDRQCVTLNTMGKNGDLRRGNIVLTDQVWKVAKRKIVAQINKVASRDQWYWHACDYRQCFQINDRGFIDKVTFPSSAWRGKATYVIAEVKHRLSYSHSRGYLDVQSWSGSLERSYKRAKGLESKPKAFLAIIRSEWYWCYVGIKIQLSR